jgi:alpha-L-fucosidase 2
MRNRFANTVLVLAGTIAARAQDLSPWRSQPATKWLEALPIGNGSLGGVFFGNTTNQGVQFNEQTLIDLYPHPTGK